MSRSLKYEIPGVDRRVPLSEVAEKGWASVFASMGTSETEAVAEGLEVVPERVLEIGFGRGEFLLAMATQQPEVQFIGIEVSWKRTLKMARKVARANLENVRLVDDRAEHSIQTLFEPQSLDAIWINFSDPWPKVRHGHRRVIQSGFVGDAAVALKSSGMLFVATDDVPYAHQIDEVLAREPRLENAYGPLPFLPEVAGRPRTGYEEQWRAAGRPMHFFAYRPRAHAHAHARRVRAGGSS
jgi:tRNA (guanine-N7-)-methyltransferase